MEHVRILLKDQTGVDLLSENSFLHFGSHTGVHFRRNDPFTRRQDSDRQVSRTRSDFQHHIARLEVCLDISTADPSSLPAQQSRYDTYLVNNTTVSTHPFLKPPKKENSPLRNQWIGQNMLSEPVRIEQMVSSSSARRRAFSILRRR